MNYDKINEKREGYKTAQQVEFKILELLFAMIPEFKGKGLFDLIKTFLPHQSDEFIAGYMLGILDRTDVREKFPHTRDYPFSFEFQDIREAQNRRNKK